MTKSIKRKSMTRHVKRVNDWQQLTALCNDLCLHGVDRINITWSSGVYNVVWWGNYEGPK